MSAKAETRRIEARGEAQASVPSARTQALDLAFAEALGRAVSDLVPADARRTHADAINTSIIRRARLFVASYSVVEERVDADRLKLRVACTIDLTKVRERLVEIGALADTGTSGDAGEPAAGDEIEDTAGPGRPRPKVVVLLQATAGEQTTVTFGKQGGDGGAVGKALADLLAEHGYQVVSAAGQAVPVSRDAAAGLPLSDDAAAELARAVGAGGAFVAAIDARPDSRVRGTRLAGAAARAVIRVIDAAARGEARLVASARVEGAGYDAALDRALVEAAADAGREALSGVAGKVTAYWPPVEEVDNAIVIEVEGYRGWDSVAALVKELSGTYGVERVWPWRLGARGVALAVVTQLDLARVASALRRAPRGAADMKVSKLGNRVLRVSLRHQVESE